MNFVAQPFLAAFAFTNNSIALVAGDMSDDDALYRTRDGEGASILWILGHLYEYRRRTLGALGVEIESEFEELFCNASATEGAGYPSLRELHSKWTTQWELLEKTLGEQPDSLFIDGEGERTRLFGALNFYTWHEASHMGAVMMLRKELGYPSASEIIGRRMKKAREEEAARAAAEEG